MEKYEHMVKIEQLPPGFKFDPTDEELVLHFLYSKLESSSNSQNNSHLIPELQEFYHHYHPSQLQGNLLTNLAFFYNLSWRNFMITMTLSY